AMDAGTPVLALADGTVTEVVDGYFDRETSHEGGNVENLVTVDHGNGWFGWYVHFSANTITVKVGDHVNAGQLLGLAGSSGHSDAAHLHLGIFHGWASVEAMFDPAKYFINPPIYQGDEDPIVIDSGTTNFSPSFPDWIERPSEVDLFPASATGFVYTW